MRAVLPDGQPLAEAHRLTDSCPGGVDLGGEVTGPFWLACLRPGEAASLLRVEATLEVGDERALGPAGRDSQGIAVVAGDGVHVAYHDGTPGRYAVYLVSGDGTGFGERRRLSDPAYAATAPSLTWNEGRWTALWAETRFEGGQHSATRILLQREGDSVRTLGETPLDRPDPRLSWGEGGPWLGFRSRRKSDRHPQLYVTRLDEGFNPRGEPVRVGRANTLAAPVLQDCGNRHFAHMSRLYGGERYVALYPLDDQLRSLSGGYQYYESGHDYERVDAACGRQGPLLIAAERPKTRGAGARLTAALLRCPETMATGGCSFPCTRR